MIYWTLKYSSNDILKWVLERSRNLTHSQNIIMLKKIREGQLQHLNELERNIPLVLATCRVWRQSITITWLFLVFNKIITQSHTFSLKLSFNWVKYAPVCGMCIYNYRTYYTILYMKIYIHTYIQTYIYVGISTSKNHNNN